MSEHKKDDHGKEDHKKKTFGEILIGILVGVLMFAIFMMVLDTLASLGFSSTAKVGHTAANGMRDLGDAFQDMSIAWSIMFFKLFAFFFKVLLALAAGIFGYIAATNLIAWAKQKGGGAHGAHGAGAHPAPAAPQPAAGGGAAPAGNGGGNAGGGRRGGGGGGQPAAAAGGANP